MKYLLVPEYLNAWDLEIEPTNLTGIIFDLDSTLLDRPFSLRHFATSLKNDFLTPENDVEFLTQKLIETEDKGDAPREDAFRRLIPYFHWQKPPDIDELVDYYYAVFGEHAQEVPHARETLQQLQELDLKMGVVTNGRAALQIRKMETAGIKEYIHSAIISKAVGLEKPQQAIFQRTLDELGIKPTEALMVGDHPINDVIGASAAGIPALWIEGVYHWPQGIQPPKYRVTSMPEIIPLVKKWIKRT